MSDPDDARPSWTFLTNHARVLAVIARDPGARVRDIAAVCLLTERTVQGILADLEEAGYLRRTKTGRRNTYEVTPGTLLRHPADLGRAVSDALGLPDEEEQGEGRGGVESGGESGEREGMRRSNDQTGTNLS